MLQKFDRLTSSSVIFLSCDMQDSFNSPEATYGIEGVLESCKFMAEVASLLQVPLIASEHNPSMYGQTIAELKTLYPQSVMLYQKISYSMYNDECKKLLQKFSDRRTIIIFGIETHCCIQQTCLDLLREGYVVHLITDATSSSKCLYRSSAIQTLAQYGVILNTSQGVFYELLHDEQQPQTLQAMQLTLKYNGEKMLNHM